MLTCFDLGLEPFQIRDFKKDSNLNLVVLKEKKREWEDIPVLSVLHPLSKEFYFVVVFLLVGGTWVLF